MAGIRFVGVGKRYADGTHAVTNLDLEVGDGELMVLIGPSGCGKTTALRMVAALEEISEGELYIGEDVVNDIEPRRRDVAMVFQNYALYPHMTIFDNIAFPLKCRGLSKAEITQEVRRVAAILGLEDMLKRRPRTLSGGQRQRVAMGRALVRHPRVFLMDEPLSNLDAKLRVQMRAEITELQQRLGVTTLYVTHDQTEAMTMGTRVAVMRKGVLQQEGVPQDVYDKPANMFVATFIGSPAMNLFRATVRRNGTGWVADVGAQSLALAPRTPDALGAYENRAVALGVRPEHLGEERNDTPCLEGRVRLIEALGFEHLVHLEIDADPVLADDVLEVARDTDADAVEGLQRDAEGHRVPAIARMGAGARPRPGEGTRIAVNVDYLHFFDLDTGKVIS
jgi:multiple sugar transport system ATP-binding protein